MLGLLFPLFSLAQQHLLIIQGEPGHFYVEHIVVAKENWYSVGRLYNISPKETAPFNESALTKPLVVGQRLKIPLKAQNFTQNASKVANQSLVPVYHVVQQKEWMFHISTAYNNVPIASLEKWNHITPDQVKAGMELIIGYLRVNSTQSELATESKNATGALPAPQREALKPISPTATPPVVKEANLADSNPQKKVLVTEQAQETKLVPSAAGNSNGAGEITPAANLSRPGIVNSGYFSAEFANTGKSLLGEAGIFKSTSGWQDGKYYALMNNVAVGTIIRVTNKPANKSVYAKVLGQLPDMKESAGLSLRISNAAAAELGTGEGKFSVEIGY